MFEVYHDYGKQMVDLLDLWEDERELLKMGYSYEITN
jgi:hypothetical protein